MLRLSHASRYHRKTLSISEKSQLTFARKIVLFLKELVVVTRNAGLNKIAGLDAGMRYVGRSLVVNHRASTLLRAYKMGIG